MVVDRRTFDDDFEDYSSGFGPGESVQKSNARVHKPVTRCAGMLPTSISTEEGLPVSTENGNCLVSD